MMTSRRRLLLGAVAVLVMPAPALIAQPAEVAASRRPEAYGTTSQTVQVVGAYAFQARFPSIQVLPSDGIGRYSATFMVATTALRAGAQLEKIEIAACDDSATDEVSLTVGSCETPGASCAGIETVGTGQAETPGCGFYSKVLAPPFPYDGGFPIGLTVSTGSDGTTVFSFAKLYYRLRVSPAPAVATFGDVPTDFLYFRAIEALAASGITSGCGGGNFCPDQPVTRGEVAKFLANALGLHWPN
jgi:hypothetical protein